MYLKPSKKKNDARALPGIKYVDVRTRSQTTKFIQGQTKGSSFVPRCTPSGLLQLRGHHSMRNDLDGLRMTLLRVPTLYNLIPSDRNPIV